MADNPVALITGAGRGIGRGIALALARQGWTIIVNYRGDQTAAENTVTEIRHLGAQAQTIQANIADTAGHDALLNAVQAAYSRLDMLVNNAGMAPRQRLDILHTTEASFDEVLNVNLKGPFFLTQRAARMMIDLLNAGRIASPKIVNIGSISAYTSSPDRAEYCISKAGMSMMTLLYADRLAEFGINVYEIRPGIIETDMTSAVSEKYGALIAGGLTPIRRWGTPDDVGRIVVAIANDALPFSTGEIINVDGGFHIRRL